ncbi:unnamed protein product [Caenorhabditis nigoni]
MALSKLSSLRALAQVDINYPNEKDLIIDLMECGILRKERSCCKCGLDMKLRSRGEIYEWRCRTSSKKDCSSASIRKDSWFEQANLSFIKALKLYVGYAQKFSGGQLEREIGVSHSTVVDWCNMIRELCTKIVSGYGAIGGEGKVVELDETAIHVKKYNRGAQVSPTVWILGGCERGTRNVFATIVENRSARTMVPIIRRNVLPESTLVTDMWKSYNSLGNYFKRHESLNHSVEFAKRAADGFHIHTNTVEGSWTRLKAPLKRGHGTSDEHLPGYIDEHVCREREGDGFLRKLLETLVIKD